MEPLMVQLFKWAVLPRTLLASFMVMVFVVSSLSVSYASHQTRNMYRDLQSLEKDFDDLEHEYEKLLLEESAWADYTRLDQLAHSELDMRAPSPDETVVVE